VNIFLLLALAAAAAAQSGNPAPQPPASAALDFSTIVTNLERAQAENRASVRAYVVTRDYQLCSSGHQEI
jgi:hypothetical protein